MRLLHRDAAGVIRLTEHLSPDIPPYAILSHRWDTEEVTFQELYNGTGLNKRGYGKVRFCGEQAWRDGLSYFWVDTCCIDKTNNVELQEAINSMFRWYQNAARCYAYLDDVSNPTAQSAESPSASSQEEREGADTIAPYDVKPTELPWEDAFRKSRWYTRGWTLQELVAPRELDFFDAHWNYLGSKTHLKSLITDITGINQEVLDDSSILSSIPVACRMSWIAGRETTRQEDMAYCLLGIFDINMAMLYGEGPKAFLRLQEHIITNSNDLSLFIFSAPPNNHIRPYRHLLAGSPKDFKGCGDVIFAGADVHLNDAYVLTNRGLYFRRLELQSDVTDGSYSVRLNCESKSMDCSRMYLRKVGASLYVRCDGGDPAKHRDAHISVEEDAYIITEITPYLRRRLGRLGEYAIQVRSDTHYLHNALQVLLRQPSSIRWDPAAMRFLVNGERRFRGCWKLFPRLARAIGGPDGASPKSRTHVYLCCGLEHPEPQSTPRAWVQFYTQNEWRGMEASQGVITGRQDTADIDRKEDHIELSEASSSGLTIIRASIHLNDDQEVPYFELNIKLEDKPGAMDTNGHL